MKRNIGKTGIMIALMMGGLWLRASHADQPYCKESTVRTTTAYVHWSTKTEPFKLSYQVLGAPNSSDFTLVYLVGGPGMGETMDPVHEVKRLKVLREELGVSDSTPMLLVDYRDTSCNAENSQQFPDDAFRTAEIAKDVQAAIRAEGLTRYVIFGHSYGTILGTQLISLLDHDGGPRPLASVLTGVLGPAFRDYAELNHSLEGSWERLKKFILPDVLAKIREPGETDRIAVPAAIEAIFHSGQQWTSKGLINPFLSLLNQWNTLPHDTLMSEFADLDGPQNDPYGVQPSDAFSERLRIQVYCHEMKKHLHELFAIERGNLRYPENDPKNPDECAGIPLDTPYDPAEYEILSPLFLYSGGIDGVTPLESARLHFNSQKKNRAVLLSTPQGGHNSIFMVFADCAPEFWKRIRTGKPDAEQALTHCLAPIEITSNQVTRSAPAGEVPSK